MKPTDDDQVHNLDGTKSVRYGGREGLRYVRTWAEALKIRNDRDAVPPRTFVVPRELYEYLMYNMSPNDVITNTPKLFGIPVGVDTRETSRGVIDSFSGYCRFLSNFFECNITDAGLTFPSAEHLYQAWKSKNIHHAKAIQNAPTPGAAKRIGRSITIREDWEDIKLTVMYRVVTLKFSQNAHLRDLLLATDDMLLIEGNNWGDKFWGTVNREGENHLGRILMEVRQNIRRDTNA